MNPQLTCSQRQWLRVVTGSNPVEVLNFFQASLLSCINCVHCDDHFFNFISFPQFIYDLFHISLTKKILMQMWICMNCPQKGLSIGLHSKHAWACWDSDRAIDFEIPRLTVNVHFPCNTWIYRECKVQNGLILWETLCNYLLACLLISWNNLLLPMEQLNFTRLILKFPDLL